MRMWIIASKAVDYTRNISKPNDVFTQCVVHVNNRENITLSLKVMSHYWRKVRLLLPRQPDTYNILEVNVPKDCIESIWYIDEQNPHIEKRADVTEHPIDNLLLLMPRRNLYAQISRYDPDWIAAVYNVRLFNKKQGIYCIRPTALHESRFPSINHILYVHEDGCPRVMGMNGDLTKFSSNYITKLQECYGMKGHPKCFTNRQIYDCCNKKTLDRHKEEMKC